MSWKRIAVTYAVALSIAGYLYVQTSGRDASVEPAVTTLAPLLQIVPGLIDTMTIKGEVGRVLLERREGRWRVAEPQGAAVTSDLIDALLETLSRIPPIEAVAADDASDAEFGLGEPSVVITMMAASDPVASIHLGDRSPTRTALYARVDGDPAVYLLGLNAGYYADLILQELAKGSAEAN